MLSAIPARAAEPCATHELAAQRPVGPVPSAADLPARGPGSVIGLQALNLVRKFAEWQDMAVATGLSSDEWDDAWSTLGQIADDARTLLSQMEVGRA